MAHQFLGHQNFKPQRGPPGCLIYVSLSTQTGCAAGLGAALFLSLTPSWSQGAHTVRPLPSDLGCGFSTFPPSCVFSLLMESW